MEFKRSKKVGSAGEKRVVDLLTSFGFECEYNPDHRANAWDIRFNYGATPTTIEVKNDLMACITPNICIEFNNCRSGKKSGIFATTADIWAHLIPNREIYIARVDRLKEWIEENPPGKTYSGGGDGNADLMLYKKNAIAGKGLFVLPQDNVEDALLLLEGLLDG
jgi:hypothetical protein